MNKRDLKRLDIDDRFILSPQKFLLAFGIGREESIEKLSIADLHYILKDKLKHACSKHVNYENVIKGNVILVGFPNNFKAYYRPTKKIINKRPVTEKKVISCDVSNYNLIELYQLYQATSEEKYLIEICERIYNSNNIECEFSKEKVYTSSSRKQY